MKLCKVSDAQAVRGTQLLLEIIRTCLFDGFDLIAVGCRKQFLDIFIVEGNVGCVGKVDDSSDGVDGYIVELDL